MNPVRGLRHFSLCVVLLVVSALTGCHAGKKDGTVSSRRVLMGTFLSITASSDMYSDKELRDILDEAFKKAADLEGQFSVFNPGSEINLLNLRKEKTVSKELFDILKQSMEIGELTHGRFDITVSPILKKNGFYYDMPARLLEKIPDTTDGIGPENIILNNAERRVSLSKDTWLDLSGIAKGHIVDDVSVYLKRKGIKRFMVNAGGDMFLHAENGDGWVIGIQDPVGKGIALKIKIEQGAVATSGDYANVIEGEETVSHIVNPETDKMIERTFSSVTVISSSCARADAFATGMMSMGAEEAIKTADTIQGIEAIVIDKEAPKEKVKISRGAGKYII